MVKVGKRTYIYKDLGLLPSCNLSWNLHIDYITARANRALSLVKRRCKDFKDILIYRFSQLPGYLFLLPVGLVKIKGFELSAF